VLSFALVFFLVVPDKIDQFRFLCFMCIGLGFFTSCFFMSKIWEVPLTKAADYYDKEYKRNTMGE